MTKNYKKGFTLIELLVVIAIIGVLAAVVLSATNSARSKGEDAKIVSNIRTIATQSAIYFDDNNAFYSPTTPTVWGASNITTCAGANTFLADTIIARAITEILNNNTGNRMCNTATDTGVLGRVNAWALVFPLKNQANTYWCIDSAGTSRKTHANGTAYNATSGSTPAALSNASDVTCN